MGEIMKVQFAKWGNSIALRVPRKLAESLGIVPGSVADLHVQSESIVITPRTHAYRLEELLDQITAGNVHPEIATGTSVGNECSS